MLQPLAHDALRRKVGPARAGRPPIRDTRYAAAHFARLLEEALKPCLRAVVGLEIAATEVRKFSAAIEGVAPPALFAVARTRQGDFGGVIAMEAPTVHRLVDAMTGSEAAEEDEDAETETETGAVAGAEPPAAARRPPTMIDEALCHPFAAAVVETLEEAIAGGAGRPGRAMLALSHFEQHAASILQTPDDPDVLCFDFELFFTAGRPPHVFSVFVSLAALDIYLAAQRAAADARPTLPEAEESDFIWSKVMLEAANAAEFPVVGVLTQMALPLNQILDMRPGAVVPLDIKGDFRIELRLRDALDRPGRGALAEGRLGAVEGRRAVKIQHPPAPALKRALSTYLVEGAENEAEGG